jgi:hypothetical protein
MIWSSYTRLGRHAHDLQIMRMIRRSHAESAFHTYDLPFMRTIGFSRA